MVFEGALLAMRDLQFLGGTYVVNTAAVFT